MTRLVVVGVDGSAHSLAALRWAQCSDSTKRARLRVVCVWTPLPWHGVPHSLRRELETVQPRSATAAARVLRRALRDRDPDGLRVDSMVLEGSPGAELARASADADLLVIGVGSPTCPRGPGQPAVGPTADYVTRMAPCPAILVKHPFNASLRPDTEAPPQLNGPQAC